MRAHFERFGAIASGEAPQLSAMAMAAGFMCLDDLARRRSLSVAERALALALIRDAWQLAPHPVPN